MFDISMIQSVNFFGHEVSLVEGTPPGSDLTVPCANLSEIAFELCIEKSLDWMVDDERLVIFESPVGLLIPVKSLPAALMLVDKASVLEGMWPSLLKFQQECGDVLYDYWLHGAALNRRTVPYDVSSVFKDERIHSRPILVSACAEYAKSVGMDPDDVFNKVLASCYLIAHIKPAHEHESLSGLQASFLASIEKCYANTLRHCVAWNKNPDDLVYEEIRAHAHRAGNMWLVLAEDIPPSVFS